MSTAQAKRVALDPETWRKISDLAYSNVPIDLELIDDHGLTVILRKLGLLEEVPSQSELQRFLEHRH